MAAMGVQDFAQKVNAIPQGSVGDVLRERIELAADPREVAELAIWGLVWGMASRKDFHTEQSLAWGEWARDAVAAMPKGGKRL